MKISSGTIKTCFVMRIVEYILFSKWNFPIFMNYLKNNLLDVSIKMCPYYTTSMMGRTVFL